MAELYHLADHDEWRAAAAADEYPHVYGPLPASAVTAVVPLSRDAEGRLIVPDY